MLPVAAKVRQLGRDTIGTNNQRQIVTAVNMYGDDNGGLYPPTMATIGFGGKWSWSEPTILTAYRQREPGMHRAVSEYLGSYIKDARVMFCPNAPYSYQYMQESWDAGDKWDNPRSNDPADPVTGTYCLYWNYTGYLEDGGRVFQGAKNQLGGRGCSKLLVSDYLGFGNWRSVGRFIGCEQFKGAAVIEKHPPLSSAYWSGASLSQNNKPENLEVKFRAGYIDGHVETYTTRDVTAMLVSLSQDGRKPYKVGMTGSPGIFYIPTNALP